MGRLFRGRTRVFNGKNYKSWTREGRKSDAIAEKKTVKNSNSGNLVRIVKAPTAAGRAGFYDLYVHWGSGHQRNASIRKYAGKR